MGSGHKANRVCDQYLHLTQKLLCGLLPRTRTPVWYFERASNWRGCREKATGSAAHFSHKGLKAVFSSQQNQMSEQCLCSAICTLMERLFTWLFFGGDPSSSVFAYSSAMILFVQAITAHGWGDIKVPVEANSVSTCTNTFEVVAYVAAWCGLKLAFQFQFGKII